MFLAAPGLWFLITLAALALQAFSMLVPLLGVPLFILCLGGLMSACASAESARMDGDAFVQGVTRHAGQLVLLSMTALIGAGVVMATAVVVLALLGGAVAITTMAQAAALPPADALAQLAFVAAQFLGVLLMALLAATIPMTALMMALWFAPALIVLRGVPALTALRLSFLACLKNWLPLTAYCLLLVPLSFLVVLSAFLGVLLVTPMLLGSLYVSFRDVFPS
jgi:hypothetical protein